MNAISEKKLAFLLPLLVLVPGFYIGVRTIFLFELVIMLVFLISLGGNNLKVNKKFFSVSFIIVSVSLLISALQVLVYGQLLSLSILRIAVLLLLVIYLSKGYSLSPLSIQHGVVVAIFLATALAYAQILDNSLLGGTLSVSEIVGKLYPYRGELSERGLNITGGLQLKTNSVFSPTSIVDGHTILAGNFFAVGAIVMLFWKKPFLFSAAALIAILTFSRGSWLMLGIGLIFWLSTVKWTVRPIVLVKYSIGLIISFLFIRYSIFWDYLSFRIMNTLYVFALVQEASGNPVDPRTTHVWPEFFSKMNEIGIHAWVIGGNVGVPTDSGILLFFRESGFLGLLTAILVFFYGYLISGKDRLVLCLILMISIGSVFNPVVQGHRLVFLFGVVVLVQSIFYLSNKGRVFWKS